MTRDGHHARRACLRTDGSLSIVLVGKREFVPQLRASASPSRVIRLKNLIDVSHPRVKSGARLKPVGSCGSFGIVRFVPIVPCKNAHTAKNGTVRTIRKVPNDPSAAELIKRVIEAKVVWDALARSGRYCRWTRRSDGAGSLSQRRNYVVIRRNFRVVPTSRGRWCSVKDGTACVRDPAGGRVRRMRAEFGASVAR